MTAGASQSMIHEEAQRTALHIRHAVHPPGEKNTPQPNTFSISSHGPESSGRVSRSPAVGNLT